MFEYQPLGNRIVVKMIIEKKSIVLPEESKMRVPPSEGLVESVGEAVKVIKAGDIILLSPFNFAGAPTHKRGDDIYLILTADQILAVKRETVDGRAN